MIDKADPKPFNIRRGVPQGTRLGPILYNLYIGDIPVDKAAANDCKIVPYVDDTIIYTSSLNPMMASIRLQRTVGELEKYFHSWGLNINATKTKMKVFTPQNGNKSRNTDARMLGKSHCLSKVPRSSLPLRSNTWGSLSAAA